MVLQDILCTVRCISYPSPALFFFITGRYFPQLCGPLYSRHLDQREYRMGRERRASPSPSFSSPPTLLQAACLHDCIQAFMAWLLKPWLPSNTLSPCCPSHPRDGNNFLPLVISGCPTSLFKPLSTSIAHVTLYDFLLCLFSSLSHSHGCIRDDFAF